MSARDELLTACAETPDDDAPRLVWADAVGGERGELVVVQCELAGGGLTPERSAVLRHRQHELLAAHGRAWAELTGLAARAVFRRGFVEAVELRPELAGELAQLRRRAPLARAVTIGFPVTMWALDAVLGAPELADLEAIAFAHSDSANPLDEARRVAARMAALTRLPRLRALGLAEWCQPAALELLASSAVLGQLESLSIWDDQWTAEAAAAFFAKMPRLRALKVRHIEASWASSLPPQLVELSAGVNAESFEILARGPLAESLERLALDHVATEDVELFARFTRLRALDLSAAQLGFMRNPPSHWKSNHAFSRVAIPSVRELAMSRWSRGDEHAELVRTFGAQLELLHLPELGNARSDVLRPGVAGHLELEPHVAWARELLPLAGEPWLDRSVVACD